MQSMLARVGAGAASAGVAYAAYRFVVRWMECRDGKDWTSLPMPQSKYIIGVTGDHSFCHATLHSH